jgi:purine nucleosidase
MGGKYSDYPTPWGPTEWNAIVDPHATHQLFNLVECPMRAFGLDITWQLSMTPREVRAQFKQHPLLKTVLDWSEIWFEERDLLHFHDPLAALCLFEPELCTYALGAVSVDLSSPARAGITHFSPASKHPNAKGTNPDIRIATGVQAPLFFERFFEKFQIKS